MYYLNEDVRDLVRVYAQDGREGYLRLDLNENPGGLPAKLIEGVMARVTPELVARYPEELPFKEALAAHLEVDVDDICLVNGSSEGVRHIIEAFTSPGGKIVGVDPSYAMYRVYAQMYGRQFVPVPYRDGQKVIIQDIIDALADDVQLLVLVNPNNPMGDAYTREEMEALVHAAKEHEITVLIDEAYHYFYPDSFVDLAVSEDHVFITRTFSKFFSMAGCRLGYVVGMPEGIEQIHKLSTPHNINVFALMLAQAVLEDEGVIKRLIAEHQEGKKRLIEALEDAGYEYSICEGNFGFIKPFSDPAVLVERLRDEEGILVKTYDDVAGLGDCLRVSLGAPEYMERFADALVKLDGRS